MQIFDMSRNRVWFKNSRFLATLTVDSHVAPDKMCLGKQLSEDVASLMTTVQMSFIGTFTTLPFALRNNFLYGLTDYFTTHLRAPFARLKPPRESNETTKTIK